MCRKLIVLQIAFSRHLIRKAQNIFEIHKIGCKISLPFYKELVHANLERGNIIFCYIFLVLIGSQNQNCFQDRIFHDAHNTQSNFIVIRSKSVHPIPRTKKSVYEEKNSYESLKLTLFMPSPSPCYINRSDHFALHYT